MCPAPNPSVRCVLVPSHLYQSTDRQLEGASSIGRPRLIFLLLSEDVVKDVLQRIAPIVLPKFTGTIRPILVGIALLWGV